MVTHERKAVRLVLPLVVLGDARDVGQREAPASGGPGRARRLGRARDGGTGWALGRRWWASSARVVLMPEGLRLVGLFRDDQQPPLLVDEGVPGAARGRVGHKGGQGRDGQLGLLR